MYVDACSTIAWLLIWQLHLRGAATQAAAARL